MDRIEKFVRSAHKIRKWILHRSRSLIGLPPPATPMQKVMQKLKTRGISLDSLNALEVFGGTGDFHTKDYAGKVSSLEIWEINPDYEETLRRNFPLATIRIQDSYFAIKDPIKKFDLVIIDNPAAPFGGHCEHFELFPDIFNIASENAIFIINVIPNINLFKRVIAGDFKNTFRIFNEAQLRSRRLFYETSRPHNVSVKQMSQIYCNLALNHGFNLKWYFYQKRHIMYYFVLNFSRSKKHESH